MGQWRKERGLSLPAVEGGKEEREDEGSAPGTEIDISSSKHTCSPVPIRGKHAYTHT